MTLILWGVQFAITLASNVVLGETISGFTTSDGRAALGYSYWYKIFPQFYLPRYVVFPIPLTWWINFQDFVWIICGAFGQHWPFGVQAAPNSLRAPGAHDPAPGGPRRCYFLVLKKWKNWVETKPSVLRDHPRSASEIKLSRICVEFLWINYLISLIFFATLPLQFLHQKCGNWQDNVLYLLSSCQLIINSVGN